MSNPLRFTSCMASNHMYIWRAISDYLRQRLASPVEFIDDLDWTERYAQLDAAQIDLAVICGAPYAQRRNRSPSPVTLLAAPVFRAARYQGRPIYFSDVVVHADSHFANFADLQGANWVFNEPGSLSGYLAMHHHLTAHSKSANYFGQIQQSGAHLTSLQWIIEQRADCTAIDSTVLDQALHDQPDLQSQIRVIDVIGPFPHPPVVASAALTPMRQQQIRHALLTMHAEPTGVALLAGLPVARFATVSDSDYDAVQKMVLTGNHSGSPMAAE